MKVHHTGNSLNPCPMKYIHLSLFALLLLSACNNTSKPRYLSTDILEKQIFGIDPLHDTTLVTKSGMIIEIPRNAISSPDNKSVTLEIKEAFSLKDILLSGLTTNDGENTLSSQGMFNLSTRTPGAVIKKQIRAKAPVADLVPGMKTFKGDTAEDGIVKWTEQAPIALPDADDADVAKGKSLFIGNCQACHNVDKDGVGPMLAGLTSKRSMNWLIRYTQNYEKLLDECDCEAMEVSASRPSAMNIFNTMTDEQVKQIFRYVDKTVPPPPVTQAMCYDTCQSFIARYEALRQKKQIIQYRNDTTKAVVINYLSNIGLPRPTAFTTVTNTNYLVSENLHRSYYYQITIDAWGWYNLDILLKDYDKFSPATLTVNVPEINSENITVSLAIPSVKCVTNGGLINNANEQYGFMYKDGKIRLPIGAQGYVLAFGDIDGQFMLAAQEFTAAENQEFTLKPLPSTPEKLKAYLAEISNNDFKTKVKELEDGKQMKEVDAQLAKLESEKPANCNCICNDEMVMSDSVHHEWRCHSKFPVMRGVRAN
jgi:mono/diheme cytochrome c family protein